MKKFLLVGLAVIGLSGCAVSSPGYVYHPSTPRQHYSAPPRYYAPHRPVCRDVFSGRDYYGRPVFRRVCH